MEHPDQNIDLLENAYDVWVRLAGQWLVASLCLCTPWCNLENPFLLTLPEAVAHRWASAPGAIRFVIHPGADAHRFARMGGSRSDTTGG
jgi:hypothetical protein